MLGNHVGRCFRGELRVFQLSVDSLQFLVRFRDLLIQALDRFLKVDIVRDGDAYREALCDES